MRFLVDAQLPPALARWLMAEGHDAEHVSDRNMQAAPDSAIWDYAVQVSAVIITKDEDFARRRALQRIGPAIVWVRWPNTRRAQLLGRFGTMLPLVVSGLEQGETLIELT